MIDKTIIIIPAYNEEKTISDVIHKIRSKIGNVNITVVNDGSTDNTIAVLEGSYIDILNHPVNLGLGAALSTGITFAKKSGYKFAITMDADNQHDILDVRNILEKLYENKSDLIIGNRMPNMKKQNRARYIINLMADIFTYIFTGKYIQDTQSGLRGFNERALNLITIDAIDYDVSSEIIIKAVKHNLKIESVNIKAIYSDYSLNKVTHGQNFKKSLDMVLKIIFR